MRKQSLAKLVPTLTSAILALGLVACGDDEDSKDGDNPLKCKENCAGKGFVAKATGDKIELDFSDTDKGAQFVIMPYILDAVATVNGGNDQVFSFTVSTATGEPAGLVPLRRGAALRTPGVTDEQLDHMTRSLFNRFVSAAGMDQEPGFWPRVRYVDLLLSERKGPESELELAAAPEPTLEEMFAKSARRAEREGRSFELAAATTATDCPAVGDEVELPGDEFVQPTDGQIVKGADYCIIFANEPTTGGSRTEIEASVKETLRVYKSVIYKDQFPEIAGKLTFKPVFVVIDFTSAPAAALKNTAGAFVRDPTDAMKLPMLYMPSDSSKLPVFANNPGSYDAALEKKKWHGTLAHELQHAIMYYFHVKTGEPKEFLEVASVDEGLAHFMEDLFGYGPENFNGFAKVYLDSWGAENPILHETLDDPIHRGASQSFWYYLVSQSGGVEFTNGAASGGGGLEFIAKAVKERATSVRGPANLTAKFGGEWTDTIGNFFGALAVYGTAAAGIDDKYTAQEPAKIKDLNGNADKTYGMKFNGFGGLPAAPTFDKDAATTTTVEDIPYYGTSPLLYKVDDPSKKIVLKASGTLPNTAASIVRIK